MAHEPDPRAEGEGDAPAPPRDGTSDDRRDRPHRSPAPTVAVAAKAPKKRKRGSPAPTSTAAAGRKERRVRLAKPRKTIAKSPMFMTSPLSIYAGVCGYDSLLDALRGGEAQLQRGDGDRLIVMYVYFGACPVFREQLEANLTGADASSPLALEEAFNRSVRHLCECRCFLRAYRPIREFAFFWRDIVVEDGPGGGSGGDRITKQDVLSGWSCKLFPPPSEEPSDVNLSPADVMFVSPGDKEFATKARAINCMNKSLTSLRPGSGSLPRTPTATDLVQVTSKIDPLFSPLGLLEELFLHDPWRLLVSTICLHVTTRPQVDGVLHEFLRRWHTAEATSRASWEEVSEVISVLGLGTKRAKALIRFSREYLTLTEEQDPFSLDENQVRSLYFVGEYGWTAYELFILKRLPSGSVKVCDHALQLYVEYQLGRRAIENQSGIF